MLIGAASRQLRTGDVDVWLTSLKDVGPAQQLACQQLLSEPERARWQRFLVPDARLQYLVTRALVRTTLSKYADVPSTAWAFETNDHGRPHVSPRHGVSDIHFNLSNTRGLVVCAVSRNDEIGIDVETIARDIDVDAVAPTVFAPEELADFRRAASEHRIERFFSYWTLKEAYIKARGMGLSLPLDGFSMRLDGPGPPRVHFLPSLPDDAASWQFARFRPTPQHCLAVALRRRGPDRAIQLREFTLE